MSTLDPAVRDLLAAIHTALLAASVRDYPVCAAQTTIENALRYGDRIPDEITRGAAWLASRPEVGEAADAKRVRFADRWDLDHSAEELPA
jgi:hypothetical protein